MLACEFSPVISQIDLNIFHNRVQRVLNETRISVLHFPRTTTPSESEVHPVVSRLALRTLRPFRCREEHGELKSQMRLSLLVSADDHSSGNKQPSSPHPAGGSDVGSQVAALHCNRERLMISS